MGLWWGSSPQPARGQRRSHSCPEQDTPDAARLPLSPWAKWAAPGVEEEPPAAASKPDQPGTTGFAPSSPPARPLTMTPWAHFLLAGVSTSNSSAACSGL